MRAREELIEKITSFYETLPAQNAKSAVLNAKAAVLNAPKPQISLSREDLQVAMHNRAVHIYESQSTGYSHPGSQCLPQCKVLTEVLVAELATAELDELDANLDAAMKVLEDVTKTSSLEGSY